VFLMASYIIIKLLFRRAYGPFTTFLNIIGFIGVIIHELSHYIMCKIIGVPTNGIKIKYRNEKTKKVSPYGYVEPKEYEKITFMQALMVGLAPLFISTWLLFWSLSILFTDKFEPIIRILAGLFCLSLLIGAAPSSEDFKHIPRAFKRDPLYSLYQILLVIVSIVILWFLIIMYSVQIPFNFMTYLIIGMIYIALKYGLSGLNRIINNISINKVKKYNAKSISRKRIKTIKSYKLGLEDAQW
ncbi:MAG: hypothetical protein ACTSQJ_19590, partial [Promethearchaeota archaeon]